jgi:hypothetical protein
MSPIKLAIISLGTAAGCLLATACSGSSKTASSTSSTPAAAGAASVAGSAAGSAATASSPTGATAATKITCSQLTDADIQPLMVDKITGVTATPAGTTGEGQTCNWATAGSSSSMSITVLSGSDATSTYNGDVQSLSKAVSLPGVGDKAARDGGDATSAVSAIKGSQYCRVAPGDGEVPGVADLEKAAGDSSDIGDANYALEAAAVATLCNRIFGSGNTTPDLGTLMANASAAATSSPSDQGALPSAVLPTDASSS